MNFLHTHKDTIEVIIVGAFGFTVSLSSIDTVLRISLTVLSIGFVIYKWVKESKK